MSKKQIVGSMSEWSGVLKDLFRQIDDGSIKLRDVQGFLEHENPFGLGRLISEWEKFYKNLFGIKADFSNLQIPKKQKGFDRLIVMAQGITPQTAFNKCEELFPCQKWTNRILDEVVTHSDRIAKDSSYAVWFRDRVEADVELRSIFADKLKEKGILGITLEERLIYELKFFKETKKHLDKQIITLCSGSCYSDDGVPVVGWRDSKLEVFWYTHSNADGPVSSRQVIS